MITNNQAKILKDLRNNKKIIIKDFYNMDPSIKSLFDHKLINFKL